MPDFNKRYLILAATFFMCACFAARCLSVGENGSAFLFLFLSPLLAWAFVAIQEG